MNSLPTIPLFPPGQIVATPGALALLERGKRSPLEFLSRHLRGDWGDVCQEDKAENELSLKHDFRLLSSYPITGAGQDLDHHRSGSIRDYASSARRVLIVLFCGKFPFSHNSSTSISVSRRVP